ncbi:MAG: cupin domain-containing protein [Azospirillaceae bacterium]|nr:cupin domain-containing protein [Azospirillaceae bacterium]
MDFDVGARLRAKRENLGLSQRELAKRAGISHATVSLIEQNRASPSVGSLKKVLDGLPMSLSAFFAEAESAADEVFFAAGDLVEIGRGAISYRQVGPATGDRAIQLLKEHYQPGADTGPAMLVHAAEEAGIVLRGRLEVTVGDRRRVLGPGDAYYFDSRQPHRFRALDGEAVEVVSACSPPSF